MKKQRELTTEEIRARVAQARAEQKRKNIETMRELLTRAVELEHADDEAAWRTVLRIVNRKTVGRDDLLAALRPLHEEMAFSFGCFRDEQETGGKGYWDDIEAIEFAQDLVLTKLGFKQPK